MIDDIPAAAPGPFGPKFHADGRVRRYPGNTVVCHLPRPGAASDAVARVVDRLAAAPYAADLTLLPPSSWHMTVFEGVLDAVRTAPRWPAELAADAPLEACHDLFLARLAGFDPGDATRFRLRAEAVDVDPGGTCMILLVPDGPAERQRLGMLRDRLSERLGIRGRNHAGYVFHVTLAYRVRDTGVVGRDDLARLAAELGRLARELLPSIELGPAEFCVFDDMFGFRPRLFLDGRIAPAAGRA